MPAFKFQLLKSIFPCVGGRVGLENDVSVNGCYCGSRAESDGDSDVWTRRAAGDITADFHCFFVVL